MNRAWSEMLINLPVMWDLGLRITVLLGLAWMLHVTLVRCNPRWRVQLWRFTAMAVLAVSLATVFPKVSISVSPANVLSDAETISISGTGDAMPWGLEADDEIPINGPLSSFITKESAVSAVVPIASHEKKAAWAFVPWLGKNGGMILAVCWSIGVCVLATRWLTAQFRIHGLLSKSGAAPQRCSHELRRIADRLDLTGDFSLRVSDEIDMPFVAGLRRPVIVLPARMAEPRFSGELPAIFAHELTHIKSHDLVWMGVSQWIAIPLWFHPLTWKMRTAHSMACEEVADATAADDVGDVRRYSGTLARVALAATIHPPVAAAISMARSPEIMARLTRLKQGLSHSPLARRQVVLSAVFGLLALVPLVSVEFAYAERETRPKAKAGTSPRRAFNSSKAERVLNFPAEHSVGRLFIALEKESDWWDRYAKRFDYRRDWDWKFFGSAQGQVTVPAGAQVKLIIQDTGGKDTSWIAKLKPDDLYELFIYPHPGNANAYPFGDAQMRHLKHLAGLKELTIRYVQVTGRGMRFLEPMQSLEKLDFYSANMGNAGLKSIGKLKSLEALSIGIMKWDDRGLMHLANLNALQEINLPFSGVPGPGFDSVVRLPNLKYISGSFAFKNVHLARLKGAKSLKALSLQQNTNITDNGLKFLANKAPDLEYLDLWSTNITDAGVMHLKSLKSLKRLNLRVNRVPRGTAPRITAKSMAVLAELPLLENLDLPNIDFTDECLEQISGLQNLKRLHAGSSTLSPIGDAGLRHLAKIRTLENLQIGGKKISDEGVSFLTELSNLKSLGLMGANKMTNDGMAKLSALKGLQSLNIYTDKTGKMTAAGISRLKGLSNLTSLRFSNGKNPRRDEAALDFSGLPNLEGLTMGGLRDKDLANLANCKNLKSLQTGGRVQSVSDAGLAHLAGLRSMERLSVGGHGVTDAGLVHLAEMDQLNSLNISGNITDAGLRHIEKLKSLESLTVNSQKNFSPGAVKRLRANLPNVRAFNLDKNRAKGRAAGRAARNLRKRFVKVGQAAPPFQVKSLKGKEMSIADYRGKVLLLYFWSTSCKPCIASIPKLKESYKALSKYDDFAMLSLSGDTNGPLLRNFVKQQKLPWPQARIGEQSKIAAVYGVTGYPDYVLIGRDGKILTVGGSGLDAALRKALEIEED